MTTLSLSCHPANRERSVKYPYQYSGFRLNHLPVCLYEKRYVQIKITQHQYHIHPAGCVSLAPEYQRPPAPVPSSFHCLKTV